jgi:cyclohexanone monooxygenase
LRYTLTCRYEVQRNPQYSIPSGQGLVTSEYREKVNENYPQIWKGAVDESLFAFGFEEVSRPTFSVNEDERQRIYEKAWNKGGGFRFMFETFGDISTDEAANNAASILSNQRSATRSKTQRKQES